MDKAKKDKENFSNIFYCAKMPTEYSGSSKFAYFHLQNLSTNPFFLLSTSLRCHTNKHYVIWEWKKRERRRAKVSHGSTANPMKQLWLRSKKRDANLQFHSNCKVSEGHKRF